jgi:uncharacterized membrane protein YfcA
MDGTILNAAIYLTRRRLRPRLSPGWQGLHSDWLPPAFGCTSTPMQTATLIIAFGLVVQGISVWKLRHALRWSRLWPFLLGAAFGVPLEVAILGWARPDHVRVTVGVVLVACVRLSLANATVSDHCP